MGVTREDFIRSGRYLEIPDEEWEKELATRKYVIDCYMKNDSWAPRIKLPVLVLLISHPSGRCYLGMSIKTHKKLGYWLAVCYDSFIDYESIEPLDYNQWMGTTIR